MDRRECITETTKHINNVRLLLLICIQALANRAHIHDVSKLKAPEIEIFMVYTPKLYHCEYNSEEYKGYLEKMKPALDHHYSINRHHPQHFTHGVKDMNLLDLIEMLCDWKSATLRHKTGNIERSIEGNQKRFGYSDELKQILKNTVEVLRD